METEIPQAQMVVDEGVRVICIRLTPKESKALEGLLAKTVGDHPLESLQRAMKRLDTGPVGLWAINYDGYLEWRDGR